MKHEITPSNNLVTDALLKILYVLDSINTF